MTRHVSRDNLSVNSEMINIVLFTYPEKYYRECQILILFEFRGYKKSAAHTFGPEGRIRHWHGFCAQSIPAHFIKTRF